MSAKAEKILRDQLEERVVSGSLRTETDPKKLVAPIDDRVDLDLRDLRAGPPRALDYATSSTPCSHGPNSRASRIRRSRPRGWHGSPPAAASVQTFGSQSAGMAVLRSTECAAVRTGTAKSIWAQRPLALVRSRDV